MNPAHFVRCSTVCSRKVRDKRRAAKTLRFSEKESGTFILLKRRRRSTEAFQFSRATEANSSSKNSETGDEGPVAFTVACFPETLLDILSFGAFKPGHGSSVDGGME